MRRKDVSGGRQYFKGVDDIPGPIRDCCDHRFAGYFKPGKMIENMIFGFALLAYPAEYRSSGIMTFMVNQEGIVYEKDLGKNTAQIAEAIREYNPDKTWKKVE